MSPKVSLDQAIDEKVSPKVSLDQVIDEKVSPKVSLDQKCHQKLCDLCNRESDQNLSVIKVAGNQKLCTNADFLLIKVQRLRRNLSSKFLPLCLCASLPLCFCASVPLCLEFTINNVNAVVYAVQVFTKNECKYQNYLTFSLYLYNSYTKIRIKIAF